MIYSTLYSKLHIIVIFTPYFADSVHCTVQCTNMLYIIIYAHFKVVGLFFHKCQPPCLLENVIVTITCTVLYNVYSVQYSILYNILYTVLYITIHTVFYILLYTNNELAGKPASSLNKTLLCLWYSLMKTVQYTVLYTVLCILLNTKLDPLYRRVLW